MHRDERGSGAQRTSRAWRKNSGALLPGNPQDVASRWGEPSPLNVQHVQQTLSSGVPLRVIVRDDGRDLGSRVCARYRIGRRA